MQDFDHKIIAYYYPTNKAGYTNSIISKRRFKVWSIKDISLITDIEFVIDEKEEFKLGEIKEIKIKVVNDTYFIDLLQSGYKVFFGQIGDIRFGEIIGIISGSA